jgi:hypothetical protein
MQRIESRFVVGMVVAASVAACSLVTNFSELQVGSQTDGSAEAGDGAADGSSAPWSCLGRVSAPPEDSARSSTVSLRFVDPSMAPLAGLAATICYRTDPSCSSPVAPTQTTDANGVVGWQVPYAARVFVTLTGTGILNTLVFIDPLPTTSGQAPTLVGVLSPATIQGFASLSPYPYNSSEGTVILFAEDCQLGNGPTAAGVHFSIMGTADAAGKDTSSFYLVSQTPDPTATETASDGVGGFLNVPVGLTSITGTLPGMGNASIGRNEILVQANSVTYATMDPYEN